MYVLILWQVGDYEDQYQRPSEVVAWCYGSDKLLKEFWDNLPVSGAFEDEPLKTFQGNEYVGYSIEEIPHINEVP